MNRAATVAVPNLNMQQTFEALCHVDSYHIISGLENDAELKREAIGSMLNELAQECESLYAQTPWIHILGL